MASSFIERASSNSRVQLAATAIASGAVVAGAILGYQHLQHQERVSQLKDSIHLRNDGQKVSEPSNIDRTPLLSPLLDYTTLATHNSAPPPTH